MNMIHNHLLREHRAHLLSNKAFIFTQLFSMLIEANMNLVEDHFQYAADLYIAKLNKPAIQANYIAL